MKKFVTILILLIAAISGFSQTKMPEQTENGTLQAGQWVYIWGTSADTLTNADTINYVMWFKGDQTFDAVFQMYSNHVSGTAALKIYTYNSIDGVNYTAKTADSLTITSITSDALYGTALTFSDVMTVYKKIQVIQSGTAKLIPKGIFITRKN